MVLSEDLNDANYQVQSYSPAGVIINGETYTHSLIVSPNKIEPNWPPTAITAITTEDLLRLIDFAPEIILLGTGEHSIILSDALLAPLLTKQHSIECMSTAAACWTYAALSAEGRRVVAGLIINPKASAS